MIAGGAHETTVITDSNGAYHFDLPQGRYKFRWSRPGFLPLESSDWTVVRSDSVATLEEVVLKTAPWALTGSVADLHGNPVDGANVVLAIGGAFSETMTMKSQGGRYRFESSRPHYDEARLSVYGDGFETVPEQSIVCCDGVHDIRVNRVVRVTSTAPSTMAVGEAVELPISTIDNEDGGQHFVYILPVSSDPSIISVGNGQRGWRIQALRVGRATLTCDYHGVASVLLIQVIDR